MVDSLQLVVDIIYIYREREREREYDELKYVPSREQLQGEWLLSLSVSVYWSEPFCDILLSVPCLDFQMVSVHICCGPSSGVGSVISNLC